MFSSTCGGIGVITDTIDSGCSSKVSSVSWLSLSAQRVLILIRGSTIRHVTCGQIQSLRQSLWDFGLLASFPDRQIVVRSLSGVSVDII